MASSPYHQCGVRLALFDEGLLQRSVGLRGEATAASRDT
jgi:hypothetical protein